MAMIEATAPPEATEAYQALGAQVGRKSPRIPAEVLVRHVLACVPAAEWPTRSAAMDAVLRRLESARREGLRIESRPARGRLLGPYATRRRGSGVRPYRTVIEAVEPIVGRCDCPDFLKNSLGLCKHILAVLEVIYAGPRRLKRARAEQARPGPELVVSWDPIRPLTGLGDWLERVAWHAPDGHRGRDDARRARLLKSFRRDDRGVLVPRRTNPD